MCSPSSHLSSHWVRALQPSTALSVCLTASYPLQHFYNTLQHSTVYNLYNTPLRRLHSAVRFGKAKGAWLIVYIICPRVPPTFFAGMAEPSAAYDESCIKHLYEERAPRDGEWNCVRCVRECESFGMLCLMRPTEGGYAVPAT